LSREEGRIAGDRVAEQPLVITQARLGRLLHDAVTRFVSGQLQRSGCALVIHDERPPHRRFSSARIIAIQIATHARGRRMTPASQPATGEPGSP